MENRKPQGRPVRKYEKSQERTGRSSTPDGKPFRKYEKKREDIKDERKYQGSPDRKYETRERTGRTSTPDGKPFRKFENKREDNKDERKYHARPDRRFEDDRERRKDTSKPTARPIRRYEKPLNADRKPSGRQDSKSNKKITTQLRLNRFIANSGLCSRRDADEHIQNGHITVNGKQVTDLGTKVTYDDDVRFKNKRLSSEKKVYILMNKPKDYVTTVEDPHAEHTVLDLIGDDCPERVYPVGRLDKATTGVLLLTNDGELTGKLTHPKFKRKKIYHVFLDKPVIKNDLFRLTEGIELDGTTVAADAVSYADEDDKSQIGIELHSGQNRVIRRMFETMGYKVKKLDRVYFAGLTKKNVKRGKWRFLTEKEVSMLKRGIF